MEIFKYELGTIVELKKSHPCSTRSKLFEVVRLGADIKIKCCGCGNVIMLTRDEFNKRIKKIIK